MAQGHIEATSNLALCYYYGEGIVEDREEAVRLFHIAAEGNNDVAQYNLGICYYNGVVVAEDETVGVEWLQRSARQNNADAIDALQRMGRSW